MITLIEKIETSVTSVSSRTTARAPTTATAPTSTGMAAATRLPKIRIASTATTGSEMVSARWRSCSVRSLTSAKIANVPARSVSRPSACRSSSIASKLSRYSSCVSPSSEITTWVLWPSWLSRPGAAVSYHVTTWVVLPSGSPESVASTCSRNSGSSTRSSSLE